MNDDKKCKFGTDSCTIPGCGKPDDWKPYEKWGESSREAAEE